jgi:kynurenine formamidase
MTTKTHEEATHAKGREQKHAVCSGRSAEDESRPRACQTPLVRDILVSEHGPTHVDAPRHLDPSADVTVDDIPLERCFLDTVVLDCRDSDGNQAIGSEELAAVVDTSEHTLSEVSAVLIYTGHYDATYDINDPAARVRFGSHYPGLNGDAVRWLADRGIETIGVDTPSLDAHPQALEENSYPAHEACAEHDVLILENCRNFESVLEEQFKLCFFPLNIRDGTGSPIRPVAIVDEKN